MKVPGAHSVWKTVIIALLTVVATPRLSQAASPSVNDRRDGTNLVINFTGRLQTSSQAQGPYTNIAGARSPHFAPLSEAPQQFWRSVLTDVRTIAAGGHHTLAIRTDGTLWSCGNNQ